MLRLLGRGTRLCDGMTRREVLQAGAISSLGLTLPGLLQAETAAPANGPAKAIILVNLIGGPSHQDMFDMKPDAPDNIRGEFKPISTSVPGLQICEHLPRTAGLMHHSSLIRTHSHLYNTHSPYNMLTGYSGPVIVDNVAKPSDHPCIGSVMQYAGIRSTDVPSFIWMPTHPGHSQGKRRAGPYGGFLGSRYDPMFTSYEATFTAGDEIGRNSHVDPAVPYAEPRLTSLKELPDIDVRRLSSRRSLLAKFDSSVKHFSDLEDVKTINYYRQRAFDLITSKKTRKAFDLAAEKPRTRDQYGRNLFGNCMLTARRLVEAGVKFVGVTTESEYQQGIGAGQWDTHGNNFDLLRNFNLPTLDQNYSALVTDLEERGMLDSTLVIVMGEMGRTPWVKDNGGRDHWTQCGFILMTGGGVKKGFVHGKSDNHAAWPIDSPVSSADYVATVYQLLGLDPHMIIRDEFNNQIPIALEGKPVHEVIA
jgi:hypothetical protein